LKRTAPRLYLTLAVLLLLDLLGIVVAPLFVPDSVYFRVYLKEKARQSTERFLKEDNAVIPDDATGWRNHPSFAQGSWRTDEHGARSVHPFTMTREKPLRLLFLGSSMINGGNHIQNDETISAYLEDSQTEALNFGTMMYTLDQSLLAYKDRLHQYQANVVVVGIDADPMGGLQNHYIPLRFPAEVNMPYLKPRFDMRLNGEDLSLVPVSPRQMLEDALRSPARFLSFLSKNDAFYYEFETFERFGILPFSGGLRYCYLRARRASETYFPGDRALTLFGSLADALVKEGKSHGASVIFLALPDETACSRSLLKRFLPDRFGQNLDILKQRGHGVIDARSLFQDSGLRLSQLFLADKAHYHPAANQIIAKALREYLTKP
jgi:hypothetical protein